MLSESNHDVIASIIKSHPEFENIIQTMASDNKKITSMFVHELRNPLSLLKGTIQYIEQKHPEVIKFKYWDQLQELIDDMENILTDASLLNVCNHIHKSETNLLQLINHVINSFMPQALTELIDLSITIEEDCVNYLTAYPCDEVKMKQVLSNLIKNAFEATEPGDFIQVHLKSLPEDTNSSGKLSIEISNNGQQIPEDILQNIFVPFVTSKKGGTGVGLALVKKIIDLHYGKIYVESQEELTTFTILLPL